MGKIPAYITWNPIVATNGRHPSLSLIERYIIPDDAMEAVKAFLSESDRTIAVQCPEGLKSSIFDILGELEDAFPDKAFLLSIAPCTGACCAPVSQNKMIMGFPNVDKILHFGAAPMPYLVDHQPDVLYINIHYPISPQIIDRICTALVEKGYQSACVVASEPYLSSIETVKKELKDRASIACIVNDSSRRVQPGGILGCTYGNLILDDDSVNCCIILTDGEFHAYCAPLVTDLPILLVECYFGEVRWFRSNVLEKREHVPAAITSATRFGIYVSNQPGQYRMSLAHRLAQVIRSHDKDCITVCSPSLNINAVAALRLDVLVSTGCPRLAIDGEQLLSSSDLPTLVTPPELLKELGERSGGYEWDEMAVDEMEQDLNTY